MGTVACRVDRLTTQEYKKRKGHDMREQQPAHADRERLKLNAVLIPTPSAKQALKAINQIKAGVKARQKFDSARNTLIFDGILFFEYEAQAVVKKLDRWELIRRIKQSVYDVCKLHRGILVGLTIHLDESAPHAHFQILGAGQDGRILRIGPSDCKMRQDVAARAWADLGLTRGKPKKLRIADGDDLSKIIHESVRELHERLPRELARLRAKRVALEAEYEERRAFFKEEIQKQEDLLNKLQEKYEDTLNSLDVAKEVLASEQPGPLTQKKSILGPNL
jgi:hypothetical protein